MRASFRSKSARADSKPPPADVWLELSFAKPPPTEAYGAEAPRGGPHLHGRRPGLAGPSSGKCRVPFLGGVWTAVFRRIWGSLGGNLGGLFGGLLGRYWVLISGEA